MSYHIDVEMYYDSYESSYNGDGFYPLLENDEELSLTKCIVSFIDNSIDGYWIQVKNNQIISGLDGNTYKQLLGILNIKGNKKYSNIYNSSRFSLYKF